MSGETVLREEDREAGDSDAASSQREIDGDEKIETQARAAEQRMLYTVDQHNEWTIAIRRDETTTTTSRESGGVNRIKDFFGRGRTMATNNEAMTLNLRERFKKIAVPIALSPCFKFLAIAFRDRLAIYSAIDGAFLTKTALSIRRSEDVGTRKVVWSHRSDRLAMADDIGNVGVWNVRDLGSSSGRAVLARKFVAPCVESPVTFVLCGIGFFVGKGGNASLLILSRDGTLRCTSLETGSPALPPLDLSGSQYHDEVTSMDLSFVKAGISYLAVGGSTADTSRDEERSGLVWSVTVWRVTSDSPHYEPLHHLALNPLSQPFPFTHAINASTTTNQSYGRRLRKYCCGRQVRGSPIVSVQFSPNAAHVAALDTFGRMCVWHTSRGQRRWALQSVSSTDDADRGEKSTTRTSAFCWWSESSIAIFMNDGGLVVSTVLTSQPSVVSDVSRANNMLGTSPEYFSEISTISTSITGKRLFILEPDVGDEEKNDVEEKSEKAEHGSDDKEAKRQRTGYASCRYRLYSISRATCREVLRGKLRSREYGSALALCRTYNMSKDLVFKQRWVDLRHDMLEEERETCEAKDDAPRLRLTKNRIHDILGKIDDVDWVLSQCRTSWPSRETAVRLLLEFALARALEMSEDDERRASYVRQFQLWIELLRTYRAVRKAEKGEKDDAFEVLTFEGQYRDCGVGKLAMRLAREGRFAALAVVFARHPESTLASGVRLTKILQNVPDTTDPDLYAHLLPAFPAKDDDEVYTSAEDDEDDFGGEWKNESDGSELDESRMKEKEETMASFYWNLGRGPELICSPIGEADTADDPAMLVRWAIQRARQIDANTGQIRYAHAILRIALDRTRAQFNDVLAPEEDECDRDDFALLERMERDARDLVRLVYECNGTDYSIALSDWFNMTNNAKMEKIVGRDDVHTSLIGIFRERLLPIVRSDESESKQGNDSWLTIIHEWLVKRSKRRAGLEAVASVIVASRPTLPVNERIIQNTTFLFRVALDCVYANSECNEKVLRAIGDIYKSLPSRAACGEVDDVLLELHNRVDRMEIHLSASERLESYGAHYARPPRWFLECEENAKKRADMVPLSGDDANEDFTSEPVETARKLLWHLCLDAARSSLSQKEWRMLVQDIFVVRASAMRWIPESFCYQLLLQQSLLASQFDVSYDLLQGNIVLQSEQDSEVSSSRISPGQRVLKSDVLESTVLSAAIEFFDSASGSDDSKSLDMCVKCLSMIPSSEKAAELKHLVDALSILSAFGVQRLPAQIRVESNKLNVLRWVFQAKPRAYENVANKSGIDLPRPIGTSVMRLAKLLGLRSEQEEGLVVFLTAESAMNVGSASALNAAFTLCKKLCALPPDLAKLIEVWRICARLGMDDRFGNVEGRRDMCSYALVHSPDDDEHLPQLIQCWNRVDTLRDLALGTRLASSIIDEPVEKSTTSTLNTADTLVNDAKTQIQLIDRFVESTRTKGQKSFSQNERVHAFYDNDCTSRDQHDDQRRPIYPFAGALRGRQSAMGLARATFNVRRTLQHLLLAWQSSALRLSENEMTIQTSTQTSNIKRRTFTSVIANVNNILNCEEKAKDTDDDTMVSTTDDVRENNGQNKAHDRRQSAELSILAKWEDSLRCMAKESVENDMMYSLALLSAAVGVDSAKTLRAPRLWQMQLRAEVEIERALEVESDDTTKSHRDEIVSRDGNIRWRRMMQYMELALRLYVVEAFARLTKLRDTLQTKSMEGLNSLMFGVVNDVRAHITKHSRKHISSTCPTISNDPPMSSVDAISCAVWWYYQCRTCADAIELTEYIDDLDKIRFIAPEGSLSYRKSQCLKMTESLDDVHVQRAIGIGARHGLSETDVVVHHLSWLLKRPGDEVNDVESALERYKPRLLKAPVALVRAIQRKLEGVVRGSSHRRILSLCKLMLCCVESMTKLCAIGALHEIPLTSITRSDSDEKEEYSESVMRERLTELYKNTGSPHKINRIDSLLQKHGKNLRKLSVVLSKKYPGKWIHGAKTSINVALHVSRVDVRCVRAHMDLLRRFSEYAPSLDYKRLMGQSIGEKLFTVREKKLTDEDVLAYEKAALDALVAVASNRNVAALAKEMKRIKRQFFIAKRMSSDKVFLAYTLHVMASSPKDQSKSAYDRCRGYLNRLTSSQIVTFAQHVVFTEMKSFDEKSTEHFALRILNDCQDAITSGQDKKTDDSFAKRNLDWFRRIVQSSSSCINPDSKWRDTFLSHVVSLKAIQIPRATSSFTAEFVSDLWGTMIQDAIPMHVIVSFASSLFKVQDDTSKLMHLLLRRVVSSSIDQLAQSKDEDHDSPILHCLRQTIQSCLTCDETMGRSSFVTTVVDTMKDFCDETNTNVARQQESVLRLMKRCGLLKGKQTSRLISVSVQQSIMASFENASELSKRAATISSASDAHDKKGCFTSLLSKCKSRDHALTLIYVLRAWSGSTDDEGDGRSRREHVHRCWAALRDRAICRWLDVGTEEDTESKDQDEVFNEVENEMWTKALQILCEFDPDALLTEWEQGLPVHLSRSSQLKIVKSLDTLRGIKFCLLSSNEVVRRTALQFVTTEDSLQTNNDDLFALLVLSEHVGDFFHASPTLFERLDTTTRRRQRKSRISNEIVESICSQSHFWFVVSMTLSGYACQAGYVVLASSCVHQELRSPRAALVVLKSYFENILSILDDGGDLSRRADLCRASIQTIGALNAPFA